MTQKENKDDFAFKVDNLTKIYKLYDQPVDRLKESLNPFRKKYHKDFYALNDVSFEIKKGETVGIIGKNGAGKSTLLKILTGVLTPSSGNVKINGRVSALLELGTGFNPELTGIENIYFSGTIMGYSREEMDAKLDDILSFADIGAFVHQPVKTYSSGMFARLAFAVAINVDPDILIVDEALSVGDAAFQMKCLRKMQDFSEAGKTILFVSHDTGLLNKFCSRGILFESGLVKVDSDIDSVVNFYRKSISVFDEEDVIAKQEKKKSNNFQIKISEISDKLDSFGDKKAVINGLSVLDGNGEVFQCESNSNIEIILNIFVYAEIYKPMVGFTLKDRIGNIVFQTNTFDLNYEIPVFKKNESYMVKFTLNVPILNEGKYSISPAIASGVQGTHITHHWVHDAKFIHVIAKNHNNLEGFLYLRDIDIVIDGGNM